MKSIESSQRATDKPSQRQVIERGIEFINEDHDHYFVNIYDDGTYLIVQPCWRSLKHVSDVRMPMNDEEFNNIHPEFKEWLIKHLKRHFAV